jgi:uncharacterized protein (TIGR02391 family)
MSGLNTKWAISELDKFLEQTKGPSKRLTQSDSGLTVALSKLGASDEETFASAQIIEKILDRVVPNWRTSTKSIPNHRWGQYREACTRAKAQLLRDAEIRENLGDNAPEISAANLHPWVWNGASSLWQSGHYRSAVEDAAKKVNAETQNKVGRRDVSETKLFQEAFSADAPKAGKPRLRRMADDGSDTYKSVQRGAMALAEGIYAGIRNPFNHEDPKDIEEQIALEYLAALSVLARWVDEATVEDAS